ncbi:Intraflagellar Transport Protein 140 [Trypanosoma rangeli]|uniref:Intraflagellar Transport Protein 140 n=1 Tax=Trypanosoma rangeli TaxID=5698 RepID=A0A422P143_TRYRA|nr:Intraflagellar Transport Protein 140 [Trypanosoma rangeli]RNF11394.1 Intraflagellar Transport Protein 140 [Trypanosoma rangeli]|eukprot:RNF11394.1 Intraflagellar Transport Protein 140 [Trypanosoma rangeli]
MLLYFVNGVASQGTVNAELLVTHTLLPIVASAWTEPSHLLVTDAEGEFIADSGVQLASKATGKVTSMAWHPTHPVLAIGWSSGGLMLWTLPPMTKTAGAVTTPSGAPVEAEKALLQHDEGSVTTCVWSSGGTYLLTASSKMLVVAWMVEHTTVKTEKSDRDDEGKTMHFKPTAMWSVPTEVMMVQALHATASVVPSLQNALKRQQQQPNTDSPDEFGSSLKLPFHRNLDDDNDECAFFLASASDKQIFALTEEQKLFPLLSLEEPPTAMLYEPAERQLVAFSVANVINVYHISEDFTAKLILRRKLSTPSANLMGERFTVTMRWASSGVLAFGCGDNRVRFFDIRGDRVYVVPHPVPAAAHITHIDTLEKKGLLAMATMEGPLAVFQRNVAPHRERSSVTIPGANTGNATMESHSTNDAAIRDGNDPAEEWELLTVVDISGRVNRLSFTTAGHIVVALAKGKMQVLRETVRKRAWDGVVAATQISMDMVVVESVTGCQCLLKSNSKIRGMAAAFPTIGLWNGQQIDLYTVNESTSTASLTNFVPATSSAFAVHPEGLFYVKDANRVLFVNFQLVTLGQIAFTEAEGRPMVIDVMGDVVVVISSTNAMRLARVSEREVCQLGPPRQLTLPDSGVVVTDARVNAQGRRVALMTRRIADDLMDSRIWVYDCDKDLINFYDFAVRGEIPDAVYWNTPEPNSNTIGELGYLLLACETHQVKNSNTTSSSEGAEEVGECGAEGNSSKRPNSRSDSFSAITNHAEAVSAMESMPDLENFAEKQQRREEESYANGLSGVNPLANRTHSVVTLFSTNKGLIVHNAVLLKRYHICLVGLTIPDFLLASVRVNGNPSNPEDYMIEQKRLRDFEGLKTEKEVPVLEALMKFSYYSTIGNMDEAYRCVKTIKNPTVWQSLARMCISSGRLDVAEVCLAQMQDGVAAGALREARTNYPEEKDVHLATLACGLGLVKECEGLLRKAKRFDLITDLLLACGKFEQARRHAKHYDRIHMHSVSYKYAQFMESFSHFEASIMWYRNAGCFSTDVPRVFFQNNRLMELHDLIIPPPSNHKNDSGATTGNLENTATEKKSSINSKDNREPSATTTMPVENEGKTDENSARDEAEGNTSFTFQHLFAHNKDLLIWWAQQSERREQFAEALKFYMLAEDVFNSVRLLCAENPPRLEEALGIVDKEIEKSRTRASSASGTVIAAEESTLTEMEPVGGAFFIGLHYERSNDVCMALQYFKYAGAWRAASRVAKGHERYGDLLALSIASEDEQLMLDNATFLEQNSVYDKAVELYHRIGDVQKAIEVCIKGGLYDTMHRISSTLDAQSDPEVFLQMAEHFITNGHYDKAAEMYVFSKAFSRALELCASKGVALTDEMAESMSSDANCCNLSEEERTALLRQIADIAKDQGNWNLACKKYTQIGERLKAMKMLMRGGDVNKVIFFANHSRSTEIYTLAGNFLQSQNWHTNPNIYKHIVLFYTKAKAFGNLISFTDAFAQHQIDENRNYYDAWQALHECVEFLERNREAVYSNDTVMVKDEDLRSRRDVIEQVVRAIKLLADSAADAEKAKELIAVCSDLIKRSRPSHQDSSIVSTAIRIGDVFALLVRYYHENARSSTDAMRVIDSMVKHAVEPRFFLERGLLEAVCSANARSVAEFLTEDAGEMPAKRTSVNHNKAEEEAV